MDCFTNYHEGQFGEVFLGDNKSCEIIGKGDILLQLEDGGQWLLKDVRHVPNLKRNLISVSQLFAQGYYPSLHSDNWKVTKGSRIIAKGNKVGNLYLLEKPTEIGAAMTVMGSDAALWHQRLGHLSKKNLEVMLKRDQLPGLQSTNLKFCEHCLYGKQKRVSFLKDEHNLKEKPLELVHLDVFGPVEVSSLGGSNFFVTFFDDCTRKVWIYMMANKSEVFFKFKVFKALVENQRGHKIKCLKTDNGGEFCSLEFDNFCVDNGICRVKVVPYTPQENGAAERLNRTIMEKARCMLSNAGLGKEFWAEACNTAIYLINQSPSRLKSFFIMKILFAVDVV